MYIAAVSKAVVNPVIVVVDVVVVVVVVVVVPDFKKWITFLCFDQFGSYLV